MIPMLDVYLWGTKVGTLVSTHGDRSERVCFYFDSDFIKGTCDPAPLRASITGIPALNGLPIYAESDRSFGGVPSFIADSLPDRWGNTVFSHWASAHGLRTRDISPLDRLAYIGSRGMGAFEFVPASLSGTDTEFRVEIDELSRFAGQLLDESGRFSMPLSADLLIENMFRVGTSAGGRRPKAILNVNTLTGECRSGQIPPVSSDFVPMIVKFDEHSAVPSARIEYSYYLMAVSAGLRMMPSRLLSGQSAAHFLTERFDRRGGEKIHVQTLAAMNPSATSYEDLFDVAMALKVDSAELEQLFLQTVMNVLAGNVDDHSRNFSFLMARDNVWHVAPVYDFTFTVDPSAYGFMNRHSLTVNSCDSNISLADLLGLARRYDIRNARRMVDEAVATVKSYGDFALQAGVPDRWRMMIEEEMEHRLEALE